MDTISRRQETIAKLDRDGVALIPLKFHTKRPSCSDWQKHSHAANNLAALQQHEGNIGMLLGTASGNLVDIDLDQPVARKVADRLLPVTQMEFGADRAHRIYLVKGDAGPTVQFKLKTARPDVDKQMIVEYRANGAQTMCPPSVHPETQEPVEFQKYGPPGKATREELLWCCRIIATVAELDPHYRIGTRQLLMLALSGMLASVGLDEDHTRKIVQCLAHARDDEEPAMRLEAVRRTYSKVRAGEPVTQRAGLIELLGKDGEAVVAAVLAHLGFEKAVQVPERPTRTAVQGDVSDTSVGKEFAAAIQGKVMYVEGDAFYVYESGVWSVDRERLRVRQLFETHTRDRVKEVKISSEHDAKQLRRYLNISAANAALTASQSTLRKGRHVLDQDDMLLGLKNGVLDLKTGQLVPHDPAHYLTRVLDVDFDANATCPLFEAFLEATFPEEDVRTYVIGILGGSLSGRTDRREFYILHGSGRNGKSTLIGVIADILGSYARAIMPDTLFEGRSANHAMGDLASLEGVRLAYVSEPESKTKLHASLLKQLTGGDTIKVKRLYQEPIELKPKAKLFLLCNDLPRFNHLDGALKRRIKCISFENVVPEDKADRDLGRKLMSEKAGILNLLIKGARAYLDNTLFEPESVRQASKQYFDGQDTISAFLKECTSVEKGAKIGKGTLYEAYKRFCDEEMMEPSTKKEFGIYLMGKHYRDAKDASGRVWLDIKLGEGSHLTLVSDDPDLAM